jgi:hypothetical protein
LNAEQSRMLAAAVVAAVDKAVSRPASPEPCKGTLVRITAGKYASRLGKIAYLRKEATPEHPERPPTYCIELVNIGRRLPRVDRSAFEIVR